LLLPRESEIPEGPRRERVARSELQRQLLEAGGRVVPFAALELPESGLEQRFIVRKIPQLEPGPATGGERQREERESPGKTMHIEVCTRHERDGSSPAR
jgi:hypothetical protein